MLKAALSKEGKSAFTLVEILVVIAILAILAVVTFVVINPVERINQAQDATRREEVQSILESINLYSVDNNGVLPTYSASNTALPTVSSADIMTAGATASTLNGVSPGYLTTIPTDPGGAEYRVGVTASGAIMVGTTLSDSTVFVVSE